MRGANVDLRKLHHALVLAETGGFTVAAERLHLTQSALTRSIQALEKQLGLRIFDRGRSGAAPTVSGQAFLRRARELQGVALKLERYAHDLASGEGGEVTAGFGATVANALLPRLLLEAMEAYPKLSLVIKSAPPQVLIDEILEGTCDLAVMSGPGAVDVRRISVKPIVTARGAFVVRSGHPLADKGTITADLVPNYAVVAGVRTAEEMRGIYGDAQQIVLCDNPGVIRDLILNTDSIWATSDIGLDDDFKTGVLKQLQWDGDSSLGRRFTISQFSLGGVNLSPAAENISRLIFRILADLGRSSA